jgi:translation initiation factor IF-2
MPEEWGGQTVTVEVSARQKTNIDGLLEMILLSSDILELKANPKRTASGTVLEAKLDKGRGPVATVLVQDGTLNVGDTFIAGPIVGRVRALIDDRGKPTKTAGPSTPVEVLGLSGLPQPGDVFQVADAAKARHIATFREEQSKSKALGAKGSRLTLESLQAQIAEGGMKELPLIIKTDVQGSAEVPRRHARQAGRRKGQDPDHPRRRRRRERVGRAARIGVQGDHHRLQRPAGPQRRGDRRARAGRHPPALGHLQRDRRDEEGDDRASSIRRSRKSGSASPRCGHLQGAEVRDDRRLHGPRRAHHPRGRHARRGCSATTSSSTRARSDRCAASRTTSARSSRGFECGIGFDKFNDLKVGDMIEVFAMERVLTPA